MRVILRRPSRGLGQDAAARICRALTAGASLPEAVERLPVDAERAVARRARRGGVLRARRHRRRRGADRTPARDGLDQHFEDAARASARPDRDDLNGARRRRSARPPARPWRSTPRRSAGRRLSLRKARDDRNGIELTTVHRAKGRQWPRVVSSPATRTSCRTATRCRQPEQEAAGEGVEAERRIAYVAFTRAIEELSILYTSERPSRFLHEAGLVAAPPKPAAAARRRRRARASGNACQTRPRRRSPVDAASKALERAHEVGLHHALTVIADRQTALEFAAVALKRELAGAGDALRTSSPCASS